MLCRVLPAFAGAGKRRSETAGIRTSGILNRLILYCAAQQIVNNTPVS